MLNVVFKMVVGSGLKSLYVKEVFLLYVWSG